MEKENNYFVYTQEQLDYIKSKDERMATLVDKVGFINRDMKPDLYTAFVDTIVGQQISTSAHNTIRKRFEDYFGEITPDKIYNCNDEDLQKLGISFRKVNYIKDCTYKIINNELDLMSLKEKSDQQVIDELVKLKGIGVWSAQMLMTFSMNRMDIIAYDDLAIRRGICKLYNIEDLTKKEFEKITEKFSPYRTVAALYFWHYANPNCEFTI